MLKKAQTKFNSTRTELEKTLFRKGTSVSWFYSCKCYHTPFAHENKFGYCRYCEYKDKHRRCLKFYLADYFLIVCFDEVFLEQWKAGVVSNDNGLFIRYEDSSIQKEKEEVKMGFLKLTPKVPLAQKATPIPHAVKPPDKSKTVRTLVGLSNEEIERVIEEEYAKRGSIILHFIPTSISNFKLSSDGRFGIRHSDSLRFFQLFIFNTHLKVEDLVGKTYSDLKWIESTQIHFYYNDYISEKEAELNGKRMITADMQMRNVSRHIAKYLGDELKTRLDDVRKRFFDNESEKEHSKFEASILGEELEYLEENTDSTVENKGEDVDTEQESEKPITESNEDMIQLFI